jgi:hypothetical protein
MTRKPYIRDQRVAVAVGLVLFAVAVLVLYDAYDRRGGRTPLFLRWALPV